MKEFSTIGGRKLVIVPGTSTIELRTISHAGTLACSSGLLMQSAPHLALALLEPFEAYDSPIAGAYRALRTAIKDEKSNQEAAEIDREAERLMEAAYPGNKWHTVGADIRQKFRNVAREARKMYREESK